VEFNPRDTITNYSLLIGNITNCLIVL
jgi:hypothetical protein